MIILIVELLSFLIAKRSCHTLGGVNSYPSYKNISTDDGEYTANISQFYELCWFLRFWKSPPKGRLPNEDRWVDLDDSNNSLSVESFIYGEIILDLESQLEMEGKVRTTWIQSITRS